MFSKSHNQGALTLNTNRNGLTPRLNYSFKAIFLPSNYIGQ